MVYANASRVKYPLIRPTTSELTCEHTRCYCAVIRLRIRIEERGHRPGRIHPGILGGNLGKGGLRKVQSSSFVGEKEERPVSPDWPTQESSKIVVMFRGPRFATGIGEPIVRVHRGVAKVVEDTTVEIVRARTRAEDDLASGRAAELRGEGRSLNPKLLQRVHRHQAAGPPESAERLRTAGPRLADI